MNFEWNSRAIGVVVATGATLLVLLAILLRGNPPNAAEHPNGFNYLCQNPNCKNEFVVPVSDYNSFVKKHPGERITCPKCGGHETMPKDSKSRAPERNAAK